MPTPGTLYVVATPLGNLGDLSPRAAKVLRGVDLVAAEDTRRSRKLLAHLDAHPRMVSFHAHSASSRLETILEALSQGKSVALVTDAGTPTISDPGVALIRAARDTGVPVVPAPGPSAVITALSVSGLPADRFTFLAFLPRRGKDRKKLLDTVAESPWTTALFEAPSRLAALLYDLADACGPEREGVVARELTKAYEEVRAGTLAELGVYYGDNPPRGEVTVLVAGCPRAAETHDVSEALQQRGRQLLEEGMSRRDAASVLASETSVSRNDAYRIITSL